MKKVFLSLIVFGFTCINNVVAQDVIYGCTNIMYVEFNSSANVDDGSCMTLIPGAEFSNQNNIDGKFNHAILIQPNGEIHISQTEFSDQDVHSGMPTGVSLLQVQAGQDFSAALQADGTVEAWGVDHYNSFGFFGNFFFNIFYINL